MGAAEVREAVGLDRRASCPRSSRPGGRRKVAASGCPLPRLLRPSSTGVRSLVRSTSTHRSLV
eukprot:8781254-Pyramimonas_sp.AAC.1